MGAGPISQPDALIGVIAALPAEARTARRLGRIGWRVTVGGVGVERTQAAAKTLLDSGVERLMVWGTAGALQPDLRPGALIVPSVVLDSDGGQYRVFAAWQAQLRSCAPSGVTVSSGPLVTARRPVPNREARASLAQQTGAVAVDMETAVVARLAVECNVPFAVVRAIVDPLEQALPPVVSQAKPGRYFAFEVMLRLAIRPRDLSGVVRLGQNMHVAKRSLAATAYRLAETVG